MERDDFLNCASAYSYLPLCNSESVYHMEDIACVQPPSPLFTEERGGCTKATWKASRPHSQKNTSLNVTELPRKQLSYHRKGNWHKYISRSLPCYIVNTMRSLKEASNQQNL